MVRPTTRITKEKLYLEGFQTWNLLIPNRELFQHTTLVAYIYVSLLT